MPLRLAEVALVEALEVEGGVVRAIDLRARGHVVADAVEVQGDAELLRRSSVSGNVAATLTSPVEQWSTR